jgi:hypothetical protein
VLLLKILFFASSQLYKGGVTPRQQLATCCLQHFLVMSGNITKNVAGDRLPIVALV